ncbi:PKD domain-containing protein [Lacibacter luteus]|uniref:PKD domain-containing protein n=1 Tax=Lacibacter luteus TaxID=2508719 RepID=A0A4Q1CES0_9BACT|nr:LamG-like jellyroll fold domain-containing protein [Lacibacter luteus]RXK58032.1 PKD domain-containing protein [Lacibacter luteus]
MRFFLTTSVLIFFLCNSARAQVNLNKGLVAYYPFNGNANDESGNRNNPSAAQITFAADRFGNKNAACAFNGRNNYIRIPDNASLRFRNGFSISVWVMVKGFYDGKCHGNRIVMKGDADYLDGSYMLTFDDNRSSNGNNCYTERPDKSRQSFYGAFAASTSNEYIVPGKWYLLTYTYDGTNALLYIDCKLQAKGIVKNYNFANKYDLFFGKMDNMQYPYWFNGLLDEIRFYNRPLSKNEISALCTFTPEKSKTNCDEKEIVSAKFGYTVKNCNSIIFNLSAASIANLKSIQWNFGDGITTNQTSPSHTYAKYGKYKVKVITINKFGCADTVIKEVTLVKPKSDFTYSETDEPGKIQFKAKNKSENHTWTFDTTNDAKKEFAPIHLYNKSGNYKVQLITENNTGCRDTVQKQISINLKLPITTLSTEKETKLISAPEAPKLKLEKRADNVIQHILVENEYVNISIYDNGIIDGDSVTLIYNDEIIANHQLLNNKPLSFRIKIDRNRGKNELKMYAENLGSIPPNTALLIIDDGNQKHRIHISSSKSSNGIISFTTK